MKTILLSIPLVLALTAACGGSNPPADDAASQKAEDNAQRSEEKANKAEDKAEGASEKATEKADEASDKADKANSAP
jgi:hypothetical protein